MTDDRIALVELLQKSGESDFLRAVAEAVLQILIEVDVEGLIGAGRHERSADRLNYRKAQRPMLITSEDRPLQRQLRADDSQTLRWREMDPNSGSPNKTITQPRQPPI